MKHFKQESGETSTPSAPCSFQCPYGQPAPRASRGSRTILWILVVLCAAFALGFGGYGIFLAIGSAQHTGNSTDAGGAVSQQAPSADTQGQNPIGNHTDPNYTGVVLAEASDEVLSPAEIYEQVSPSIVQLSVDLNGQTAYGTAVVLTANGYLLTQAHSFGYDRTADIQAVTADNTVHSAAVVGYDSTADLAVLKIEAKTLTPATFAPVSTLAIGDWVYAVSGGMQEQFSGVLTRGIVSARERTLEYDSVSCGSALQTDAAIGYSGSGSPLVNQSGQVVGLNISNSYLGEDYTGESYALPIESFVNVIQHLVKNGYVSGRVRLGITGVGITQTEASTYGVPRGVMIAGFTQEHVFLGQDVQEGDILTAIGGETVTDMSSVSRLLQKYAPGDTVEMELFRVHDTGNGGESFSVTVTLLEDFGETQR